MVLLAWEKRLRERGVVVKLVDATKADVSARRFVEAVTGLDAPDDSDGAANRLAEWIDAVSGSGLPPVVLIDEMESVVEACEARFFDRLRGLLGRVCLVATSRDEPDRVFARNEKTSPLTNQMQVAWVGLLEPEGVEAAIGLGGEQLGPGDADLMRHWCGRHSFFLQLLGSFLVDARRNGAGPQAALVELERQAPTHLRPIRLSKEQRKALLDAARGLPAKMGVLLNRGLVTEDGLPFGEVFARWLRGGEVGK